MNIPDKTDPFGETDPRKIPSYYFLDAVSFDWETARKADVEKQNYIIGPRFWYVDATSDCSQCGRPFVWTATEQQIWFEKYRFWVSSHPKCCRQCYAGHRKLAALRSSYAVIVTSARDHGSDLEKRQVIAIVSELEQILSPVPTKMIETKELFERQLAKAGRTEEG